LFVGFIILKFGGVAKYLRVFKEKAIFLTCLFSRGRHRDSALVLAVTAQTRKKRSNNVLQQIAKTALNPFSPISRTKDLKRLLFLIHTIDILPHPICNSSYELGMFKCFSLDN